MVCLGLFSLLLLEERLEAALDALALLSAAVSVLDLLR